MQVVWTIRHAIWPVFVSLCARLAIPYTIAKGLYPLYDSNAVNRSVAFRYVFALTVCMEIGIMLLQYAMKSYEKLEMKIFQDKYLVGRRLSNHTTAMVGPALNRARSVE